MKENSNEKKSNIIKACALLLEASELAVLTITSPSCIKITIVFYDNNLVLY